MAVNNKELSAALMTKGLIDEKALKNIEIALKSKNLSLEEYLFEKEIISDEKIGTVIAELYQVPFVKLKDKTIPAPLLRAIPHTMAARQYILPFEKTADEIHLAINNPRNYELLNFIEKKTGLKVKAYYATKKDIKSSLKAYNSDVNQKFTKLLKGALADRNKIESLKDAAKILDTIILFAYQNSASDIHIEPHKEGLSIRYRIDGILHNIAELPLTILDLLITRIKVLANMRTDEHRAAQDGRIKIELEGNEITLRVSIIPIYDGEKTVMRILSSSHQELDLEALGYSEKNLKFVQRNIVKTHGILLITGPTGSGKTTTLYSILKLLNSPEVNISTIEDPIEYRLEGVNQIQVNPKTNLTFALGLRSLLRQDPDIVMVGEIRDEETAHIAINAALTGHLVLATLHTNDVASTLPRLIEMKVEPFLLSATAQLVIAQRLVRGICGKCKKSYSMEWNQLKTFEEKLDLNQNLQTIFAELTNQQQGPLTFYKGEGCSTCNGTGYKGRTAIAEVMEVTDSIKKLILKNAPPMEIEQASVKEGMILMFIDGMQKVLKGMTTIEEILRVMRT
ncbi:type II/IV secretion system protein [Candidatus Peregrinibacteria bacterium]|nr:type II/IV secretion system protein [Candidatus Peregrinibacteria bacterium]